MLTKTFAQCVKFSYRKTLYATVAVTLDIFFFVYVHLRCIPNSLKKISKMATLPSLEKFLGTPMMTTAPTEGFFSTCFV